MTVELGLNEVYMRIAVLSVVLLVASPLFPQEGSAAGDPIPGVDISLEQKPGGIVAAAGDPIPGVDISLEQKPGGVVAPNCAGGAGIEFTTIEPLSYERTGATLGGSGFDTMKLSNFRGSLASICPVMLGPPSGPPEEHTIVLKVEPSSYGELLIDGSEPDGGLVVASGSYYALDITAETRSVATGQTRYTRNVARFDLENDTPWRNDLPGGSGTNGFVMGSDGTGFVGSSFRQAGGGLRLDIAHTLPADANRQSLSETGQRYIYEGSIPAPGGGASGAWAMSDVDTLYYGLGAVDLLVETDLCGATVGSVLYSAGVVGVVSGITVESTTGNIFMVDSTTSVHEFLPSGSHVASYSPALPGSPTIEGIAYREDTGNFIVRSSTDALYEVALPAGTIIATLPGSVASSALEYDRDAVNLLTHSAPAIVALDPTSLATVNESLGTASRLAYGLGKLFVRETDSSTTVEVYDSALSTDAPPGCP